MANLILLILLALGVGPAMAEGQPSAICLAQCSATLSSIAASPPATQACLIRCRAGAEFNAANRRALQPAMRVTPRPEQRLAAAAPAMGRMTAAAASTAAMAVAAAGNAPPSGAMRWGAIYAAQPPATAVGVSQGASDRTMVHVRAESECRARGQSQCRLLTEFSSGCGAAAQAIRSLGLLPTGDSSTERVSFIAPGTGANRTDAERAALSLCNGRDPTAACRVVASVCLAY